MKRLAYLAALAAAVLAVPCPAVADEIDDLARKLNVRPRWHGYKPEFHYTQRTYAFTEPGGAVRRTWRLAMDGPRYVALVPDDHLQLLGFTVGTAPTSFAMPAGRYVLDAFRGPFVPTQSLIPPFVRYQSDGSSNISRTDHFRVGGTSMTLVRASIRRTEVVKKYVISVHEQLGYMIEGAIEVTFRKPDPATKVFTTDIACSGAFQPWPNQWVYDKTAFCPSGTTDVLAYANNTAAMARLAEGEPLTIRDGGFVAYLNAKDSWSPCRTFSGIGPDANMTLDPRSNMLHVRIPIPPEKYNDPNGFRQVWTITERLFSLPPELVTHIRKNAKPAMPAGDGLVIRLGRTEEFEDQPLPLDKPVRGLVWSKSTTPPRLLTTRGASGKKCLLIAGATDTNVPEFGVAPDIQRIHLRPATTYRIEAMMKSADLTADERRAYRDAYDNMAAKMKAKDETPPDFEPLYPHAEAYVTANLHDSPSPDARVVARHRTTVAKADNPAWQKVEIELLTPEYDTYLRVGFVCHSGTAMLDDFSLTEAK